MYYRQSILFFGLVLPLLACGLLVGGAFYFQQDVAASFAGKGQQYKISQQSRVAADNMEKQVAAKRPYATAWKALLAEETKSEVNNQLRKIQDSLPAKEFQKTATDSLNMAGGFASVSAQKSSQIRLGFRGTYRAIQRAFLELETRMPQLQLQEFRMDSNTSQASLNNVDVTYTAWEN
jgi:hypothetical protein